MFKTNSSIKSIVVSLYGGLGNQLFQYATGKSIALKNNLDLILDLKWFEEQKTSKDKTVTSREFALEPFALDIFTQVVGLPTQKFDGFFNRFLRNYNKLTLKNHEGYKIYKEKNFKFDEKVTSLNAPIWLDGYWQSFKYFEDIRGLLQSELNIRENLSPASKDILLKIENKNAICIHVRRGDYISNKSAAAFHGTCDLRYYKKGLELLRPWSNNSHCFIFSDEPDWVKNNITFPVQATVVSNNSASTAHEDLYLMSSCNDFIIANSSFSWWGAWLSSSKNKRVIAPKTWFTNQDIDTSDLIPNHWTRI